MIRVGQDCVTVYSVSSLFRADNLVKEQRLKVYFFTFEVPSFCKMMTGLILRLGRCATAAAAHSGYVFYPASISL